MTVAHSNEVGSRSTWCRIPVLHVKGRSEDLGKGYQGPLYFKPTLQNEPKLILVPLVSFSNIKKYSNID